MRPVRSFKLKIQKESVLRWIGAFLAAFFGAVCLLPVGDRLVEWSFDLPFIFRDHLKTEGTVIVYLDSESFQELNQDSRKPWDRLLHAQLLDRLTQDQARAVAYDIEFFEPWPDPATDERFAAAMRANGKVVLAASYETVGQPGFAAGSQLSTPIDLFTNAAAGLGLIHVKKDPFRIVREHDEPPQAGSLAWATATIAGVEATQNPAARLKERWINYYGPPEWIPSVSFFRALSTDLPAGFFRDKTVFIGGHSLTGLSGAESDEFATPYTRWTKKFAKFAPGVELHATMYLNLARQDWLRRFPAWVNFVLLLVSGVVLGRGLTRLRPLAATGAAVLAAGGIFGLALLQVWRTQTWFPWLIVVAVQLPVALFWSVLYHYVQAFVQQRLLEQTLELHLSPSRVKELMGRPDLLRPGASERRISILFSDIANFSKVTERMLPKDLVPLLNNYFEATLTCIHEADGTVVKLIGDAIYAIWNAPLEQIDHQSRVCRAALRMREQLVEFDTKQRKLPLRTRVGLHTGNAYVGNFGSTRRFDFTAIGQSVNLASRLEGLNKHLGTDILATREIQSAVESEVVTRPVGYFRFKGFDHVAEVYELIGTPDCESATRPWRTIFEEGLYLFQRKEFAGAEKEFRRTLEVRPEDGPAKFYLGQIAELRACPPGAEWSGEIDMKEK